MNRTKGLLVMLIAVYLTATAPLAADNGSRTTIKENGVTVEYAVSDYAVSTADENSEFTSWVFDVYIDRTAYHFLIDFSQSIDKEINRNLTLARITSDGQPGTTADYFTNYDTVDDLESFSAHIEPKLAQYLNAQGVNRRTVNTITRIIIGVLY